MLSINSALVSPVALVGATKQPGAKLCTVDYLSACAVGYSPMLEILLDNALFVKQSN